MRYQDIIYVQTEPNAIRNKDMLNLSTSSDMCSFAAPTFTMTGATTLSCNLVSGDTAVHIISTEPILPLTFKFTGNTNSFGAKKASFRYEIYKYSSELSAFIPKPVYTTDYVYYTNFTGLTFEQEVPINKLNIDGDYLIKGFYEFPACTDYLKRLGKRIDTSEYKSGSVYLLCNPETDYFFIAIQEAEKPTIESGVYTTVETNANLYQQVIYPKYDAFGIIPNSFLLDSSYQGSFVITLNGLVLSPADYTQTGQLITLKGEVFIDDVITVLFTKTGGVNLATTFINVVNPVVSGATNAQGTNEVYFNTTTGKYEIYTTTNPVAGSVITVMINGAVLANGLDYYQSSSNIKRIILEGDLILGDIITIVYYPQAAVVNGVKSTSTLIGWKLMNGTSSSDGEFAVEISTGTTFTTLVSSVTVPYNQSVSRYSTPISISGAVGTELFYRVRNTKQYKSICGNIIESTAVSETIPIRIETNAINTY